VLTVAAVLLLLRLKYRDHACVLVRRAAVHPADLAEALAGPRTQAPADGVAPQAALLPCLPH
jgi:hypothetical protein